MFLILRQEFTSTSAMWYLRVTPYWSIVFSQVKNDIKAQSNCRISQNAKEVLDASYCPNAVDSERAACFCWGQCSRSVYLRFVLDLEAIIRASNRFTFIFDTRSRISCPLLSSGSLPITTTLQHALYVMEKLWQQLRKNVLLGLNMITASLKTQFNIA